MVLRTAMMHENIRKECASIYHVIERLSTLTASAIQDERSHQIEHRIKHLRSLSWENLNHSCELISNYQFVSTSPKTTAEFIRHLYQNRSSLSPSTSSSSSCSSTTTHCSFSTSGSWTLDLPLYNKNTNVQSPILPISNESKELQSIKKDDDKKEKGEEVEQQHHKKALHRSETFIVTKIPQKELSSASSNIKTMTVNERNLNSNVQRCSLTRSVAATTTMTTVVRPSRLPSRCSNNRHTTSLTNPSNLKTQSSNDNNRSLSLKKASKLPIRTTTSLTKQATPVKKSNVPTSVTTKTKKDLTVISTRAVASITNTTTKKTIRPPMTSKSSIVQTSSAKCRSRSITTVNTTTSTTTNTSIPSLVNKRTRTTPPTVKKSALETVIPSKKLVKSIEEKPICPIEQMNSTSSESSIEENQQRNKLITIVQDEGYSTWSSTDVKDETVLNDLKKNETDERQRSTGLVKNWLDTSNKRCSRKPVKEVKTDKLEEFSRELSDGSSIICPFVRNHCSNGIIIPLASTTLSTSLPAPSSTILPIKDISLDSLDDAANSLVKEQTIVPSASSSSSSSSSSTFSRSETFEKILNKHSLPIILDDLPDSTDSTCSDVNPLFNMSEYIEDNFLDQDINSIEHSLILNSTIKNQIETMKPQKRLMFPGLINRLIFLRRVLSDSDLQQKLCCIAENEIQFHVYHTNTINEHSIELNLLNTYGSESELHVWSHDCAEQRRFVDERQKQFLLTSKQSQAKLSHIERMIRMTFDDNEEDETNLFDLDSEEYDQPLAVERQRLLQQIYEYPWLLQEDDIDQATIYSSPTSEQPLLSPSPDLVVPSHNPDFYQLCALTNSSSFATSYGTNSRHTTPPIASSVL
ncbi:unnamed protein product [Adineta steineri]|nr:unnamed protein product [Adineta steineri]